MGIKKEKIKIGYKFFSFTIKNRNASRANWFDHEPTGWVTPLETAIELTKKSATADDDILESLVLQYEDAIEESQRDALGRIEATALKAVKKGLWTKGNLEILRTAIDCGEMARKALNPVSELPESFEEDILRLIKVVQILVKANPEVLRLPFVIDTMIYILRRQKYASSNDSIKPIDLKDLWLDFLHKRPKGKKMQAPESLRRLINKIGNAPVKLIEKLIEKYDPKGEGKDKYDLIGEPFGMSGESLRKKISIPKRRGRPKKMRR